MLSTLFVWFRGMICFGFSMGNVKNSYFLFGDAGGAEKPTHFTIKAQRRAEAMG